MLFDLFDSLRPIQVVHMKPGLRTWQEVSCSKACLLIQSIKMVCLSRRAHYIYYVYIYISYIHYYIVYLCIS